MARSRDPEVTELTTAIKRLVSQAHSLSRQVGETVDELEEYVTELVALREREQGITRADD